MDKFISEKSAISISTAILSSIIIYHLLIVTGIISYEAVWGGRLDSQRSMIVAETISILLNLLMLIIIGHRSGFISWGLSKGVVKVGLWLMVVLFTLNTFGNLASINFWEKVIFTPITIVLALMSLRLAKN